MGDYGLNQTLEYIELCLDSWDNSGSGGQVFEASDTNPSLIKYSWPQYFFTSKTLNVAAIKVLQAEIPFVFDVITTANNKFVFNSAGVDYNIVIPTGTYTGPQLAAQLQTLLAAIVVGFTVTWSSQLLKFIFTNNQVTTWTMTFADRKTAYSPLGFVPGVIYGYPTVGGIGTQVISAIVAQISGPYYLYVNSSKLGSLVNFNLPDGSITNGIGPEICRIPINVQYGSVIFYSDPDPSKWFDFFAANQFDSMDFYLTLGSDQYQKPLDLKGSPWSLKLGLLVYRAASNDLYQKPFTKRMGGVRIG